MKKLTLATLLLAGVSAFNASAKTFEFDPDQDGTFIDVDVLTSSIFPNDPVLVHQYFGGDGILNDGDEFFETFTYNFSNSTGDPDVIFPFPALTFEFTLTGTVENVMYGPGGAPDTADPATFEDRIKDTSFETDFNTTAEDSSVSMVMSWMGSVIGQFDLVAQVNTPAVSLDGSTTNQAFIFDYQFNDVWAAANSTLINDVWRQDGGALVDVESFTLQAQGSAGPNGTTTGFDVDAGGLFLGVNTQDNGSTFRAKDIPEPASIAVLALGLLGLSSVRRKKA